MALRPLAVTKDTPFLGEACALCKGPFAPGDELVICPEDATRHHVACWRANSNRCTAFGCAGRGEVADLPLTPPRIRPRSRRPEATAQPEPLPAQGFHCAQSCLLIAIALAIVIFAIGCFGLWAIADYIMLEVLGWQYRPPAAGAIIASLYVLSGLINPHP
ncbi:MAG: RING finger protein [Candidatus Promineifilaceae bacterium]